MSESNQLTLEEVMEKEDMTKADVMDHIAYIFSSETKYAIYYVIDLYEMLNLKGLAKMLGKSASTIHKHLEDLTERGYIQVANTVKGKFYEITPLMKSCEAILDEQLEARDFESEMKELKTMSDEQFLENTLDKFDDPNSGLTPKVVMDYTQLLTNQVSTIKTMAQISVAATGESFFHIYLMYLLRLVKQKNLSKLEEQFEIINNHHTHGDTIISLLDRHEWKSPLSLEQHQEIIMNLAEKKYRFLLEAYMGDELTMSQVRKVMPIGGDYQTIYSLELADLEQLARYFEVLINFHKDIRRLEQEFKDENVNIDEELLTTQILSLFSGPLGKM